jgi:predicted acyltransferase
MNASIQNQPLQERITSVDFFRGFTMFLLAGESTHLFEHLAGSKNGLVHFVSNQLQHHVWNGLLFWDLIQPFFMFIVGVSIPFAVANRLKKGDSLKKIQFHAYKRAFLLLFFGWTLYFIEARHLVFQFQNVLCQLSFTYLLAFMIRDMKTSVQLMISIGLLLFIDLAYRFFPVEGFNHPWVNHENLGAWFNKTIEGVSPTSEWSSLNFVATSAHTIWGVLCGRILMSEKKSMVKIRTMIIAGLAALIAGYSLDWLSITPIIKKIATSSFVFASGGWAILALAFCYWLIDVRKVFLKGSKFFIIVGMNSIFIYLFFHIGSTGLLIKIIQPFIQLIFHAAGEMTVAIITSLTAWAGLWYICYWLFKNRIFIKI